MNAIHSKKFGIIDKIQSIFKLMRVHHWIKNLLCFAALLFSQQLFVIDKLVSGVFGFLAFCLISSAVYIINDIYDREKDRNHPTKSNRPIASGVISVRLALIILIVSLLAAFFCNLCVWHPVASIMLLAYLCLNLAYSFGLKNIPILDITILVIGFLIRVMYGAIITGVAISNWFYLTVMAFSFFFALGKRRNELKKISSGETRGVLKAYPESFLDKSVSMCLTLANAFYALWSLDKSKSPLESDFRLVLTVPIVLLISLKYSMDIEGDSSGDPIEVLLHDKILIVLCILYAAIMLAILYL